MWCIVICIFELMLLCCSNQGQYAWQKYIHIKLLLEKPETHLREIDIEVTQIFTCVIWKYCVSMWIRLTGGILRKKVRNHHATKKTENFWTIRFSRRTTTVIKFFLRQITGKAMKLFNYISNKCFSHLLRILRLSVEATKSSEMAATIYN